MSLQTLGISYRMLYRHADNLPSPKSKLSGGGGVVARNCCAPTFSAYVKLHVYAPRAHQLCFFHQRSHCEDLKPSFERYHYMNSSHQLLYFGKEKKMLCVSILLIIINTYLIVYTFP